MSVVTERSPLAVRLIAALASPAFCGALGFLALLIIVEACVRFGLVSPLVVTAPTEAIAGVVRLSQEENLISAAGVTFALTACALLIEIVLGIAIGCLLFARVTLARAYTSWLVGLSAAPIFLLYPLFMVIIGRNVATLIVMGVIPGIIPIILYSYEGLRSVPPIFLKVGTAFRLSATQRLFKIYLPAAAPTVTSGIRLALINTITNIIAIEYLVGIGGLGRIVSDRYFRFDIAGTYSAIIAVTAITVLLTLAIGHAEKRIRRGAHAG